MNKNIVVVDYGIGNIHSVEQALIQVGATNISVSSDKKIIEKCDALILPGVGSFSAGIQGLKNRDLITPIKNFADSGRPLLGICLGAQMLLTESEEFGLHKGLDLIPGKVTQIPKSSALEYRVPLIGWAELEINIDIPILRGMNDIERFYFVHSFHCIPTNPAHRVLSFQIMDHDITALISNQNIYGAQFHPEKSSSSGLKLLSNFINL